MAVDIRENPQNIDFGSKSISNPLTFALCMHVGTGIDQMTTSYIFDICILLAVDGGRMRPSINVLLEAVNVLF